MFCTGTCAVRPAAQSASVVFLPFAVGGLFCIWFDSNKQASFVSPPPPVPVPARHLHHTGDLDGGQDGGAADAGRGELRGWGGGLSRGATWVWRGLTL